MSKSSNWESTIKPIVVLSVISLIASLLLALVNGMTAPVIAENTKRTTLAAYVACCPPFRMQRAGRSDRLHHRRHHRRGQGSGRSTAIKAEEKALTAAS